ncbi:unnamed protein product [Notodromas monacha]|uniref:Cadherin domain-containing protein n=1 Tax=Notodromas monacha TaxID=399045 RepID=A0A7R9GDK2_9CRUS|nr:unnamed protein product [Notodromas monacha]CAG0916985.1 unnamed protein product [Notodromas monacha]
MKDREWVFRGTREVQFRLVSLGPTLAAKTSRVQASHGTGITAIEQAVIDRPARKSARPTLRHRRGRAQNYLHAILGAARRKSATRNVSPCLLCFSLRPAGPASSISSSVLRIVKNNNRISHELNYGLTFSALSIAHNILRNAITTVMTKQCSCHGFGIRFMPNPDHRNSIQVDEDTKERSCFQLLCQRFESIFTPFPRKLIFPGAGAVNAFRIRALPCDAGSTVCYAEIYLIKPVEAGRIFDTILEATNKNGASRKVDCRIEITNYTTANALAFPNFNHEPIVVLESASADSTLRVIRVNRDKGQNRLPTCELRGGDNSFKMDRSPLPEQNLDITLKLNAPLDYEKENLYHMFMVCEYAKVETDLDTRNLVSVELLIKVEGEQDTPPIFTYAPPLTRVPGTVKPGDELVRVKAKDADLGQNPREIRYSLWQSPDNPWLQFFHIGEKNGSVTLKAKLDDLLEAVESECVVMLTIEAEELITSETDFNSANQATKTTIGFVMDEARVRNPPSFSTESIFASVKEHSPSGTEVLYSGTNTRPYVINPNADGRSVVQVAITDDDNGLFEVSPTVMTQGMQDIQIRVKDSSKLDYEKMTEATFKDGRSVVQVAITDDDNGLFEVSPTVMTQGMQDIQIRVKDSSKLDYEKMTEATFKLLAYRVGNGLSTTVTTEVTVKIEDVNDNAPVFSKTRYFAQVPEDAKSGTQIIQFSATDADSPDTAFGQVLFTRLDGPNLDKFILEQSSGILKIARNPLFDQYTYTVEARDNNGDGNLATAELVLQITDVNDNPPKFAQRMYAGVLNPGMLTFQTKITVKAEDADEGSNGEVLYAIEKGNENNLFMINSKTGEINVRSESPIFDQLTIYSNPDDAAKRNRGVNDNYVIVLIVKAYDKGNPSMYSTVPVEIYTQETVERTLRFVLPHSVAQIRGNQTAFEQMLKAISGGRRVDIVNVDPYNGDADASLNNIPDAPSKGKSIVTASVLLPVNALVDVAQIVSSVSQSEQDPVRSERTSSSQHRPSGDHHRTDSYPSIYHHPADYLADQQMFIAEQEVRELRAANTDLLAIIIALTVILLFIIILLIIWLINKRNKMKENEKAMLLKDEESNNNSNGEALNLRQRIQQVFSPGTYQRPIGRSSPGRGRVGIWSPTHGGGDSLPARERRYQRAAGNQQQQSSLIPGKSNGRRFFIVRDADGMVRGPETLREGEQYMLEDIEDEAGPCLWKAVMLMLAGSHVNVYEDDQYRQQHEAFFIDPESGRRHRFSQIGNSQILTLVTPKRGRRESDGFHADDREGYHSLPYNNDERQGNWRQARSGSDSQLIVPLEEYQRNQLASGLDERIGKEMIMNRFMEHQQSQDGVDENGRRRRKIHTPIAEETMSALELEMRDGRMTKDGRRRSNSVGKQMGALEEESESRIGIEDINTTKLDPPASPFVGYVHNKASKLRHKSSLGRLDEDDSFHHTHLTRNSQSVMSMYPPGENALMQGQQLSRRNSIAAIEGIARRRSSASARAELRRNSTVGFENVKFGPLDRSMNYDRSWSNSVEPDGDRSEKRRHNSDPNDARMAKNNDYMQQQQASFDDRKRGSSAKDSFSPENHRRTRRDSSYQGGSRRNDWYLGSDSESPLRRKLQQPSEEEQQHARVGRKRSSTDGGTGIGVLNSPKQRDTNRTNRHDYAQDAFYRNRLEQSGARLESALQQQQQQQQQQKNLERRQSKDTNDIIDNSEARRRRASREARRMASGSNNNNNNASAALAYNNRLNDASSLSLSDIRGEAQIRELRRRRDEAVSRDGNRGDLLV